MSGCTALSYSKNSSAGLGMPARLKLLRYHLKPPVNQSMAWAWGTACEMHIYVCSWLQLQVAIQVTLLPNSCAHKHLQRVPLWNLYTPWSRGGALRDSGTRLEVSHEVDLRSLFLCPQPFAIPKKDHNHSPGCRVSPIPQTQPRSS